MEDAEDYLSTGKTLSTAKKKFRVTGHEKEYTHCVFLCCAYWAQHALKMAAKEAKNALGSRTFKELTPQSCIKSTSR